MITCRVDNDLELRLYRPDDAEALFAMIERNRAHLRPWFRMVEEAREPADTRAWIQRMIDRQAEEPRGWSGIYERGRLVGSIGVTIIDRRNRLAEIGYWMSADACGRGLCTRACTALLAHLFDERSCTASACIARRRTSAASRWRAGSGRARRYRARCGRG